LKLPFLSAAVLNYAAQSGLAEREHLFDLKE